MGDPGCQTSDRSQLLCAAQAGFQFRFTGFLFGHLLFGIGDAVEHLVQRSTEHSDLLRAAARRTMLTVARSHTRHALGQLLQMFADRRPVAEQDDAYRGQCQQTGRNAGNQPQPSGVTFEIVPAPGNLQQPVDAPAALFQRQKIRIHLATANPLVATSTFAVGGKLLNRGLVLVRLDGAGESH